MTVRALLQEATGLNLSPAIVERAVKQRMASLALRQREDYPALIAGDELKALVELVVVPESWMFRDPGAFAAATAFVRRRLAARPERQLRILSIPCAGGEEPYSMAMALQDAGVARKACGIDGLDLSSAAIARAIAGRYTRNAFRGRQLEFRDRYFTQEGDEYCINEAIREQVSFSQGNLLAFDVSPSAGHYDVIFCRNLLIYFDEPTAAAAIANLSTLLAGDGLLLAGYAEVPAFCRHGFVPLRVAGAFALQKEAAADAPSPLPPPLPSPLPSHAPRRAAPPARKPAPPPAAARRTVPAPAQAAAPDAGALLAQARKQADAGDYRGAAAGCNAALAANPDSAEAYFILGMVSECEKKVGAADDYWRRCVYLQPDHYEALCHLALLSEQVGNAAQAASFKQRAARIYQRRQGNGKAAT